MSRLSGILFLSCLLAAGAARASIPEIPVASEIEIVRAEFGIFGAPDSNEPAFTETAMVPLKANQGYGWIVLLKTNRSRIRWREEFTLPEAPETWESDLDEGVTSISSDGKTSVIEREVTPDEGLIFNAWAVAPSDPPGHYVIRVIIEGIKEVSFEFDVQ